MCVHECVDKSGKIEKRTNGNSREGCVVLVTCIGVLYQNDHFETKKEFICTLRPELAMLAYAHCAGVYNRKAVKRIL